jgi:serine/threonine-protein kinase HipA
MGRKKIVQNLKVYLGQNQIGALTKNTDGSILFEYDEEWIRRGYAISLSLPLADRVFAGARASFYFDNLLPDNKTVLQAIARKFGAPSERSFDLLSAIGHECVGALSFYHSNEVPEFKKVEMRAIGANEIAERLRGLSRGNPLGMDDGDFRLSLAGAQEKMALLHYPQKKSWFVPKGATPTTHILKRAIGILFEGTREPIDFNKSVDNEWICLYLARLCGIRTPNASIETFDDQRVICVERFDRVWKDKQLIRIPLEDLCQATGNSPLLKYERNGGPSLKKMMDILATSNNSEDDRKLLFKTALFNDLIYNTDGHAKNFSIFHTRAGFALTPLYDLLSAHFLSETHPSVYLKQRSSLSINGKYVFQEIDYDDWKKEAEKCGLNDDVFQQIVDELKACIPQLKIPANDYPADLDLNHLELILNGIRKRAKLILSSS